jgi:hypothetical protein
MQPGDTCARESGYTSYEQERDSTNTTATILLAIGGVMAAGAIARIAVVQSRRRTAKRTPVA